MQQRFVSDVSHELLTPLTTIRALASEMREADSECVRRAQVFVDHDEALAKAGDLLQAAADGAFAPAQLQATLAQMCRGEHAGRVDAQQITLYKSVGGALQDLAGAQLLWQRRAG